MRASGSRPSPPSLKEPNSYLARMYASSCWLVHVAASGLTSSDREASSWAFTAALPRVSMCSSCASLHESICSESTLVMCAPSLRCTPEHRMQKTTPRLVEAQVGWQGKRLGSDVTQSAHTSLPAIAPTRRSTTGPKCMPGGNSTPPAPPGAPAPLAVAAAAAAAGPTGRVPTDMPRMRPRRPIGSVAAREDAALLHCIGKDIDGRVISPSEAAAGASSGVGESGGAAA